MIEETGKLVYFMLPGIIANMSPVLVKKIAFLDVPISKRWLGSHKTYRGFFFGILGAIVVVYLQQNALTIPFFAAISFFPYVEHSFITVGFLIGFGVLGGDAIKSFFKRRRGIAPGKPWFPFDQLDAVIGAWIALLPIYVISFNRGIVMLILAPILHIGINHVGYYLKLKTTKG